MTVVGWVEFLESGATRRAVLDAESGWTCEAAAHVAESLNRECAPAGDPADDGWGQDVLVKAALRLGGIAWLGPGPPPL